MNVTGNMAQLFDGGALAIVLSGTLLATIARCGWADLLETLRALARLFTPGFNEDSNRTALARIAGSIAKDGPLRAEAPLPPDPALAKLVTTYLRHSSFEALSAIRRAERTAFEIARARAVRTLEYAGELAPVFGLVGTLFAITQLIPEEGTAIDATLAALGTAVLSTLYGVLAAHLVCIPLARMIERRSDRESEARERLADWLETKLREEAEAHRPEIRSPQIRGVA